MEPTEITLKARATALGAASAEITLLYQGSGWEYNLFLLPANNKQNAPPGTKGVNMMDAWFNAEAVKSKGAPITGIMSGPDDTNGIYNMVSPVVMATTTRNTAACTPASEICDDGIDNDCDGSADCDDSNCTEYPAYRTGGMNYYTDYGIKGNCNADRACIWSADRILVPAVMTPVVVTNRQAVTRSPAEVIATTRR